MCNSGCGCAEGLNQFRKFQKYFRALHCPIRWVIIRLLANKKLSTSEIYNMLKEAGEEISKSALYYHLSELQEADIIELAEYREIGGGAPEKVWKLKVKQIKINFLEDLQNDQFNRS